MEIRSGAPLVPQVVERAFPLWREFERLPGVLAEIAAELGASGDRMAVTMTAELADCFASRAEGVRFVLDAFGRAFPSRDIQVYGVDGSLRPIEAARLDPLRFAAANWMAGAALVAGEYPDGVFLDVGSTTTDIIPIAGGRVASVGRSDTERLQAGELVYTGALRTPICAIVRSVAVGGRSCRVAAEWFAIAADAHVWLGAIDEREYTAETPDGKGPSRDACGVRLARMVCADAATLGRGEITAIARCVAGSQVRQIAAGIRQVVRRLDSCPGAVVAGGGAFLARAAAGRVGLAVSTVSDRLGDGAARAVPATALARLLASSS